jgi:DNA-binding SARP family transcriptional activator/class 3 adenylate cyclase
MDFHILGPLEVRGDDDRPLELGGRKQRALLAVLLLHANRVLSSDSLVEALWGESPPGTAATALQGYVSQLRKTFAPAQAIVTRAPGYMIELREDELDLNRFERLLEEARSSDVASAAAHLRKALALWRGRALGDLADEPFARSEALRLEELRLVALEERIEADLVLGRHAALVGELEAYVAQEPLRERPRGLLMLALYRSGRQAEALAAYREARRVLVDELGIEPSRGLQELEQAILRQDPELDLPTPSVGEARREPDARAPGVPAPGPPAAAREERKVVSVLFVDPVGFTGRADLADPEDVRAALRPFHAAARREIERFGGMVEKFVGDAVMAVFGAPLAHEDDPERAVRAALALRQWVTEEGEDLQVRMAVNTGMALVSLAARPSEVDAVAAGNVVNLAQRLQVAAPVNGIFVGEQTYRATRQAIEYRQAEPVEAKGQSSPVAAWEALEARSRLGVDFLRGARTPLVGRQRELDLLVSALRRVREERSPQLVTLVGVPGIGKSRLVFELFGKVEQDQEPITWRQGRCVPYGDGVSFWALGEIVKAQAGILESDGLEQVEQKLHAAVVENVSEESEAPWVERQLRPLVGAVAEVGSGNGSEDAFGAWRHFLEGLADLRPLVLVLEDLHWADDGLLDFVDELADRVRDAPLLVLCTARPELLERRPGWGGGKANALTISLPPLSDEETARLVAAVLEQPRLEGDVHAALLARAAGNPLYAEQFARVLAEVGTLDELPETVQGIIAARLDGLLPEAKALLQDAAVIGKVFWLGAVESIGAGARQQAEELLLALERKEFVQQARRSSIAGEAEYAFRHVLLRDVAYSQIPRAARAEKHGLAAEWIESLGRSEDHAEMLAHHYLNALEYTKAVGGEDSALRKRARLALRAAGDRALALASYAAAERSYSAALELWPKDDPARPRLLFRRAASAPSWAGGDPERLVEARDALLDAGENALAAEAEMLLAETFRMQGRGELAEEHAERGVALLGTAPRNRSSAAVLARRANWLMLSGELDRARSIGAEACALAERVAWPEGKSEALRVLGTTRVTGGDRGGLDDLVQSIEVAAEAGALAALSRARNNLSVAYQILGELEAAYQARLDAAEVGERLGSASLTRWFQAVIADFRYRRGEWDNAVQMTDDFIAAVEAGSPHYLLWQVCGVRAEIRLARADSAGAVDDTERALAAGLPLAESQVSYFVLAASTHVYSVTSRHEQAAGRADEFLNALNRGEPIGFGMINLPIFAAAAVRLDLGRELIDALTGHPQLPWTEAVRAYVTGDFVGAAEILRRIGSKPDEAEARLRAAEQLVAADARAEADEQLEQALAFYRSVGATRYLAQAEELRTGAN